MKLYKLNYFVIWLSEVLPYGNWNPSQTLPYLARYILPVAQNIKSQNTLLEIPWISSSFRRKLFGKEQARYTKECIKFLVFNTWSADQFQIYLSSWGCLPKIQYIPLGKCLPLHCQTVAVAVATGHSSVTTVTVEVDWPLLSLLPKVSIWKQRWHTHRLLRLQWFPAQYMGGLMLHNVR